MLTTRLKQAGVLVVALLAAAGMVRLGWWQLDVYREQAQGYAEARAAEPARALSEVAPPGALPEDGYGRSVTVTGTFSADHQYLVPVPGQPGRYRVLTALVQPDGARVPVVRGQTSLAGVAPTAPRPPEGVQQLTGILLASEAATPDGEVPPALPAGQLGAVRLPEVAQTWDPPLVNGFVTLDRAGAAASGLEVADVTLPEGEGQLRNGGYALQWVVFAVFGLGMAGVVIRDIGRRDAARTHGSEATTPV